MCSSLNPRECVPVSYQERSLSGAGASYVTDTVLLVNAGIIRAVYRNRELPIFVVLAENRNNVMSDSIP